MADNSSTATIFQTCLDATNGQTESSDFLVCVASKLEVRAEEDTAQVLATIENARDFFLLSCVALVFVMQAGFAMVCAGNVRRKNLQNTMTKNLLDACGSAFAFYAVGYAFAFGDNPENPNAFVGTANFFLSNIDDNLVFWVFQWTFSAAATTIVVGSLAERCQMSAYFYYSVFLSGFVYPVVVHAIWSPYGFLSNNALMNNNPLFGVGVLDYAGAGVVHVTGGMTALIATVILGPRRGRFHDEETGEPLDVPNPMPGHSVSLQMLGTLMLWFGWYGFNCGSTMLLDTEHHDTLAALAATNTTLSAGVAGLSALMFRMITFKLTSGEVTYDLQATMNGCLSGLVASAGGCGLIEPWAAVVTGIVSGGLYELGSSLLIGLGIDDAVDGIPVHLINGLWGLASVGLFASPTRLLQAYGTNAHPGAVYGEGGTLFGAQMVGGLFIIGWAFITMMPFYCLMEYFGIFRSSITEEMYGLDQGFRGGLLAGGEVVKLSKDEMAALEKKVQERMEMRDLPPTPEVAFNVMS